MPDRPVTLALIGAGNRGADVYARHATGPGSDARFVAVAEPNTVRRERFASRHDIPAEASFTDWRDLLKDRRIADAVIIATPDREHVGPARAALDLGYEILLEKPVAPDLDSLLELAEHARTAPGRITVAHVLRHAEFFSTIRQMLQAGAVGQLATIQHTENIGFWHFGHSFVRGNWRRAADTAPMILAKACHDLDLLRWLVDAPCESVSSYGELTHFRAENAPEGSTKRCTDGCAVERACPYSAIRLYLDAFGGNPGWPNSALTPEPTPESVLEALETGPYGRCVYHCDNDVADHQVVALRFAGGVSATLTVSAFTQNITRDIHVMGSHGEIRGNMATGELIVNDFRTHATDIVGTGGFGQGHSAADQELVRDFLARLRGQDTGPALTSLEVSIESHLMAFAAERSRHGAGAVGLDELGAGQS